MSYITQEYDLNMIPGGVPVRVPVSQYDAGSRTITFNLYAGTEQFAVPSGATAQINGTKPDGKSFSYAADISGSSVSATITEQMTAAAGRVNCEIALLNGSNFLGSANFVLLVEKAALPEDADLSKTELSTIQGAITETKENADAAAGSATEAAASAAEAKQNAANSKASAAIFSSYMEKKGPITLRTGSTFAALTEALNGGKMCFLAVYTLDDEDNACFSIYSLDYLCLDNYAKFSATEISSVGQVISTTITWTAKDVVTMDSRYVVSEDGDILSSTMEELTEGLETILAGMTLYETRLINIQQTGEISGFSGLASGVLRKNSLTAATLEITSEDGSKLHLVKTSGSWGPLMWENPPMMAGVSYATTEKWQGNTVYCQLIDCGTISHMATVDISAMKAATIIRYSGTVNGTPTPYGVSIADNYAGSPLFFARVEVNQSANNVMLFENGLSGTWTVTLWYTLT